MAKPLVSDELWQSVQALLPAPKPRRFRYPGRKRLDDRKALTGILFVLKIDIPWEDLPIEMGCGKNGVSSFFDRFTGTAKATRHQLQSQS